MNTTAAPMISPTRLRGSATSSTALYCARSLTSGTTTLPPAIAAWVAVTTVSRKAPNSAVAASTAVAIAMPLVIALVVLPTASSEVSTLAPSSLTSPDISAMPCALSDTGPKVSIETMTPTVVSRPVPASAMANSDEQDRAAAEQEAPKTAAPMSSAE